MIKKKTEKVKESYNNQKKIKEEKTLCQKLLPGAIVLVFTTIITVSIKYTIYSDCSTPCILGGMGLGSSAISILYIILKGIKDYGVI